MLGLQELEGIHRELNASKRSTMSVSAVDLCRRRPYDEKHVEELRAASNSVDRPRQAPSLPITISQSYDIDANHYQTAAQCLAAMTDVSEALRRSSAKSQFWSLPDSHCLAFSHL